MKNNTEKAGGPGIVKETRKNEHNAGTAQTGRRTPRHWRSWPRRVCAGGLLTALAAGIFAGMPVHPASVSAAREAGAPRSRGVLRYEEAVADAADLQEIHAYITEKKNAAAGTLLQLGTKFWQGPEGIVCDRNPDSGPGDADVTQLGWPMILQAVTDSQKVPEGLKVLNPEAALHIEGVGESTDCYVTAVADNISRGKAAWADGQLLLGNGADNDRAYEKGRGDGGRGEVPDLFYPIFGVGEAVAAVRHVHAGAPAQTEGRSGCYQNSLHVHREIFVCGAELYKTDVDWRPNPDEPEGGSWHGGGYTCGNHGGLFESPGTCRHEDVVETATWSHDLVCGLDGAVYANIRLSGTDTEYTDEAVRLEAVLEEGSEFGRLSWKSEDRLVWTDAGGSVLGTGSELTVQSPGTYYCSIDVNNTDIDNRTAAVGVRINGLILKRHD
mgnify:FL=1